MNDIIIVTQQPKKKRTLWQFIKDHKEEIIVGTIAIGGALLYLNRDKVAGWLNGVFTPQQQTISPKCSMGVEVVEQVVEKRHIEVPTHVRNLPVGQKASPLKLEQAAEMGYDLEANQTWVIDYAYEKVA